MKPLVIAALLGCMACGGESAPQEAEPSADESATSEPDEAPAADEAEGAEKVAVAADGTEFEPPVEKAQVPDGVWICDMGSVHYARQEQGDGTCPRCGMDLVQHGAHGGDDHDHDH